MSNTGPQVDFATCPRSHHHVTAITYRWGITEPESNYRSVPGRYLNRNVSPSATANQVGRLQTPRPSRLPR